MISSVWLLHTPAFLLKRLHLDYAVEEGDRIAQLIIEVISNPEILEVEVSKSTSSAKPFWRTIRTFKKRFEELVDLEVQEGTNYFRNATGTSLSSPINLLLVNQSADPKHCSTIAVLFPRRSTPNLPQGFPPWQRCRTVSSNCEFEWRKGLMPLKRSSKCLCTSKREERTSSICCVLNDPAMSCLLANTSRLAPKSLWRSLSIGWTNDLSLCTSSTRRSCSSFLQSRIRNLSLESTTQTIASVLS